MSHILLTGATGLLGRYLIRDLIQHGHSVAVLVRSSRTASAADRVDEIMKHWEPSAGVLATPKVLEGNITQPNLGLSDADQQWAAANCSSVIHSAASLKFQPAGDEPWNSNLNGTRNVVEFCETNNIAHLFYISTAYVCGKIHGVAYETAVPGNSEPRNVYEASKRQAEQQVLNADLIAPPTILRPSIIIGDSQTGYTSTFHGPYLPLRLSLSMLSPAAATAGGSNCTGCTQDSQSNGAHRSGTQEHRAGGLGVSRNHQSRDDKRTAWSDLSPDDNQPTFRRTPDTKHSRLSG